MYFFIFSLIFIAINYITPSKQTPLFFVHFLQYLLIFWDKNVNKESEQFSENEISVSGFCQFEPDVAYKTIAY